MHRDEIQLYIDLQGFPSCKTTIGIYNGVSQIKQQQLSIS